MEDPIWLKTPEKRNIGDFLQFQSNVRSKWGELPKLYLFLIKLTVQAYIIFTIAVLHSHVAKKNGGFNVAEKRVYFYTLKHRPSVNGGSCQDSVFSW